MRRELRVITGGWLVAALLISTGLAAHPLAGQWWHPYPYPYPAYGYHIYPPASDLTINVTPKTAEVYVDGYYAGRVDDFDGPFQRLHVTPGEHEVVVYLRGHRSLTARLYVGPDSTRKVTGQLDPLGPNEPDPGPPIPAALPPASPSSAAVPPSDPRQSPAGRAGMLAIRVQPRDAELLIDGTAWQTTPGDQRLLVELSEGRHVIELVKSGYRRFSTEVEIRPRQTTPLNVSLTKE